MAEEIVATEKVNPYSGMSVAEIAAARKAKRDAAASQRAQRMAELKAQREAAALQKALARAATDKKYNFTQRPEGYIDEKAGVIRYYGWNGGKTTGQWVLREAALTENNLTKYSSRVPAMEYAVKDIKSTPVPVRDIMGGSQAIGGFTVDATGNIVTRGKVDANLLSIKSDYDQKMLENKRITREKAALDRAIARATTNPIYNFMSRPEGKVTDDRIYFYGWVGSKDSGEWRLYEAKNTPENMENYGTRISKMEYYAPSDYRDVLIPKYNIFGQEQSNPIITK